MKDFFKRGIIFFLFASCTNGIPPGEQKYSDYQEGDGFCLAVDDSILIHHTMIDYYDLSTHMIYLKENYRFPELNWTGGMGFPKFTVYAAGEEIYQGFFWPGFSSTHAMGPYIEFSPSFYPGYIIKIDFISISDSLGNRNIDPRGDQRIINALKKYRQFHEGLSFKIEAVQSLDHNMVYVKITVKNRDSFNYYILSPDKMGVGLFHYFTNGLFLVGIDNPEVCLEHKIQVAYPEPWNYWTTDWLDLLYAGEEKSFTWTYEDFDVIQPGNYTALFQFPGLSHMDIDEIKQENGRIWLGEVRTETNVSFD